MLNRNESSRSAAANHKGREQATVNVDPDFFIPAGGERGNPYLRAVRILFPRAS